MYICVYIYIYGHIYVSSYNCIHPDYGFYSRNMLLMVITKFCTNLINIYLFIY